MFLDLFRLIKRIIFNFFSETNFAFKFCKIDPQNTLFILAGKNGRLFVFTEKDAFKIHHGSSWNCFEL